VLLLPVLLLPMLLLLLPPLQLLPYVSRRRSIVLGR
jgi:hypothetical protein